MLNGTNRQPDIRKKIEDDFASRSLVGAWSQPLCWTLAILTTHLAERAPVVMWSAFGLLSLQTAIRLILLARMGRIYAANPRRWQVMHTATILGSFAIWGLVAGWSIRTYGYHNEDTLVMLFYHAAISFAMVNTLIHDLRLMKVGASVLFGPVLFAQLFFGGPARWAPLAAFVFYLVFLITQGRRLTLAYQQQIHDNQELAVLAHNDYLTGLPNRLSMNLALERSLREAREQQRQLAVLYIDLDGFKHINDCLSHRVGDLFLAEVATRLAGRLQDGGFVARLGGDEFGALVTNASPEIAAGIAADLLNLAREPVFIENHRLEYSASIGVSFFPADADNADHLMRAADHAMYDAKSSGKDRICFFQSSASIARDLNNLPASKLVR